MDVPCKRYDEPCLNLAEEMMFENADQYSRSHESQRHLFVCSAAISILGIPAMDACANNLAFPNSHNTIDSYKRRDKPAFSKTAQVGPD